MAPLEPDDINVPVQPILEVLQVVALGKQYDFREEILLYHAVSRCANESLYHFPHQTPPVMGTFKAARPAQQHFGWIYPNKNDTKRVAID
jgi:hypothetical protein